MVLRLAGEVGQASLAMAASSPGARASVDQHAAEIRGTLTSCGRPVTTATLLSYAEGFTEAAIARGWWPPHRQLDETVARADASLVGISRPEASADASPSPSPQLDWESLRLAAICLLLNEAQGRGDC
ncbi:MAG TPA: DUF6401 family natural product biosynthesis protein [Trebonia sp.]|nr:DUF6401 family natural product biosynthesis protein [Trebonia sp.]